MSHPLPVAVFVTSDLTVCVMRQHLPRKHQSKLIMMLTKLCGRLHLFGLGRSQMFLVEGLGRAKVFGVVLLNAYALSST